MRVSRVGFTSVKGARHRTRDAVDLSAAGPVGDRVFALFDPARARCLRTVENPTLVQTDASWDGERLTVSLPRGTADGTPEGTGEWHTVDYWGRPADLEVVAGPWAQAYARHLGRDVLLARTGPGQVVYGAPVSLVTTSSLALLEQRTGRPVRSDRFRATFTIDTGELPAHAEDAWVGRTLRLGSATVRVRARVPRCAVVDLDPRSGARDGRVLEALAGYRRGLGEIAFGVDAVVVHPGRVEAGDPVVLGRD